MSLLAELTSLAQQARQASRIVAQLSSEKKNAALAAMAEGILRNQKAILAANIKDVQAANEEYKSAAFIDRLTLDAPRLAKMSEDLRAVISLPDPVGDSIKAWERPNGLRINKVRVALGVIAIIYESRPNVTSDCAGLCLKSGNAVILRGGKESLHSNTAIHRVLQEALGSCGLPVAGISLVQTTDREAISVLLRQRDYIDLVIPRGGEALIRLVVEQSQIPVIKHYKGICHTYVDESADLAMANEVAFNAKVQRPSTCNAMECLLVHQAVAQRFLSPLLKRLQNAGVEIRGCSRTQALGAHVVPATDEDYATEYLDLKLSVKVVDSLDEALAHIARFGTKHSEAIITADERQAERFLREVDAACVFHNASTRFTDGYEFGLGAEIGVSTDKLHARGPMGLEELTTYKYVVTGNGQLRT